MPQMETVKPSFLVSLKTRLRGTVDYEREDFQTENTENTERTKWQTTRIIPDKQEHDRGVQARGSATTAIRGVCIKSSFGLLCPLEKEPELLAGIAEAHRIKDEYNATATRGAQIDVNVIMGRVASDDIEAARAIASELGGLLQEMDAGIADASQATDKKQIEDAVDKIRKAAIRVNAMGGMLDEQYAQQANAAVKQARHIARQIVSRVQKQGENIDAVLAELDRTAIGNARFAFLDTEQTAAPLATDPADTMPAADQNRFAGLAEDEDDLFGSIGADDSEEYAQHEIEVQAEVCEQQQDDDYADYEADPSASSYEHPEPQTPELDLA